MYYYQAYGLNIQSAVELPELMPGGTGADVRIEYTTLPRPVGTNPASPCLAADRESVVLGWSDIGILRIQDGNCIQIDPLPNLPTHILRLFVLGSALAILLYQRGLLVLHASAVNMGGQTIALIGDKGWGKSTTAAALHKRGHTLIADDLVAIQFDDQQRPITLPGYPQLKLSPESLITLGENPADLPRIRPELDKRAHRLHDEFQLQSWPLGAIYILGGGPQLEITNLPAPLCLMNLIKNVYVSRYGTDFFQKTGSQAHFMACNALVQRVPVRLLKRQADLNALPDIVRLLEADHQTLMPVLPPLPKEKHDESA